MTATIAEPRTIHVAARSRDHFDQWRATFTTTDNYVYIGGSWDDCNDDIDWPNVRSLDHWALNADYSVRFVNKIAQRWKH